MFSNIFRCCRGRSTKSTSDLVGMSIDERRERKEKECIAGLLEYCRESNVAISESLLFRFASFHDFDLEKAKAGVARTREKKRTDYLNLKMDGDLLKFFERRILYPLKGTIKTKSGCEMQAIYFRPSRLLVDHELVVDSLQYVMNDLSRLEHQSRAGIAIIINLAGHSHKNFQYSTVVNFFKGIEGGWVPTKVNLCIMVDAPPSFVGYWKFCKSVASCKFCKKLHAIKSSKLSAYFEPGFEEYLPHEFAGCRYIDEDVDDYLDLKIYEDKARTKEEIVWNEH